MEKIDARKLTPRELSQKRKIVIKLRKKGIPNKEIAQIVGMTPQTTSEYYTRYKKEGKAIFEVKQAGRPKKVGKRLTNEHEQQIIRQLIDKTPQQLQFKFALWTREAVRQLIKQETGEDLSLSTVGYYLKRWQFTSKKPIKRAYERNDAKVQQWLQEEYPKIQKQAQEEGAQIQWGDETASVSLPSVIKGYAPKGKTPVLEHTAKRFKIKMISSITNRGKLRFMLYEQNMDAALLVTFLERLIEGSERKVFLILDNLRVHHSKIVKAWVEEHSSQIVLFYLPAYSPDLNPDEYLNNDFKRNVNSKHIPSNTKELTANTENFMNMLSNNPTRVANYFQHEKIAYAAG